MTESLAGYVVLLTGASSGIGADTARALVDRGAQVVLGARREDRLTEIVAELGADRAAARVTDVADDEDVRRLVALALERFGRLDAVFCNAGLGGGGGLLDGDRERWREILLTNVYGVALTVNHALAPLLDSGRGHVILTSSVAGRKVSANHMYSASKHAVEALGEGLRQQLTGRVRVTLIAPGMVETELEDWPQEMLDAKDVARVVAFCIEQPASVAINHVTMRHVEQDF
jgi:NADP-dependent 3-hydroxy acid dehydrogenase YdfG